VNDTVMVTARVIARSRGRAIPIVDNFSLTPDPPLVFGIAPIRVVSEQRVQAIAYGLIEQAPQIITIWNPLNRESNDLIPFAQALNGFLESARAANQIPRIWLPHRAALEIIDLLAHRYRRNRNASAELNSMGSQCKALIEESTFPGQQAVAVACDLLSEHVATGQSPVEDRHLGALLAWLRPRAGVDTIAKADSNSLLPAAAMLERSIDDEVERLRKIAKKGAGAEAIRAREQIGTYLRKSAQSEWNLLVRGRQCFWGLGLGASNLGALLQESRERLSFALSNDLNPPSRAHTLAARLYDYELSMDKLEDAAMRSDRSIRERARRKGRAVTTDVIGVRQPKPGRHPCSLVLRTTQEILRVRRGTTLQILDRTVMGRVLDLREDASGAKIIELRLDKGVQSNRRPQMGSRLEWVDTVIYDGRYQMKQTHATLKILQPPLAYDNALPARLARRISGANLLSVARRLRKGQ
jgi:hypothetical protein